MSSQFEQDFPSFKNQIPSGVCDQCDDGYYYCSAQIKKNCLDKVKVREAIEKQPCNSADIKYCTRCKLLQELNLDGEQK